ncbi:phospholipase A [Geothermobacter ehrlichii]
MPLGGSNIGLYVQYWDGYGESLIDHGRSLTRVGLGLRIR